MSISLMTAAFKTALPSTQKFVLVALCDSANDQGECYPSIRAVADKCSLGERTVQDAVTALEVAGYVRREFRHGRSTVYWMTVSETPAVAAPRSSRTPAVTAPPAPQQPHPTPAVAAPITVIEPSIEPKKKEKASAVALPSDLSGIDPQVVADWLAIRKLKKAPLTQTAMAGMQREAAKAGLSLAQAVTICCERNWAAFKADWHTPKAQNEGNYARQMREKYEQVAPMVAAKTPGATKRLNPMDVLDGLTRITG